MKMKNANMGKVVEMDRNEMEGCTERIFAYQSLPDSDPECTSKCGQSTCYRTGLAKLACNMYRSVEELKSLDFNRENFNRAVVISQELGACVSFLERRNADLAYTGNDYKEMLKYHKSIADIGLGGRIVDGIKGKQNRSNNDRSARNGFETLKRVIDKITEKDKYGVEQFVKHIIDKYDW